MTLEETMTAIDRFVAGSGRSGWKQEPPGFGWGYWSYERETGGSIAAGKLDVYPQGYAGGPPGTIDAARWCKTEGSHITSKEMKTFPLSEYAAAVEWVDQN